MPGTDSHDGESAATARPQEELEFEADFTTKQLERSGTTNLRAGAP